MTTPREELKRLLHKLDGMTYGHNDDERADVLAAALRAEHEATLERAAQICRGMADTISVTTQVKPFAALIEAAKRIRALIPPAAAPAACPRCGGDIDHGRNCAGEPAAETGKAQRAEARIRELEWALEKATIQIGILLDRMRGCDAEVADGRRDADGHGLSLFEGTAWIAEHRAKLAARAAPPKDPPAP